MERLERLGAGRSKEGTVEEGGGAERCGTGRVEGKGRATPAPREQSAARFLRTTNVQRPAREKGEGFKIGSTTTFQPLRRVPMGWP